MIPSDKFARPATKVPASKVDATPVQPPDVAPQADAVVENGLAYDGCTWVVEINGDRFAPSPASVPMLEERTPNIGRTDVRLTYYQTGDTATAMCGWGATNELPEVHIIDVTPR